MNSTLDVSRFPSEQSYGLVDGSTVDLKRELLKHEDILRFMGNSGMITANDSFGFAMLKPIFNDLDAPDEEDYWDYPENYVWFVGGWGPDRDKLIANAVRKLRPVVRDLLYGDYETPLSTLDMRVMSTGAHFENPVDSQESDGSFKWGDFPWGGAASCTYGEAFMLVGACSGFTEIEDDIVTRLVLGNMAKPIILDMGINDN